MLNLSFKAKRKIAQGVGVNNPANNNIYEVNAINVLNMYGDFVTGSPESTLAVMGNSAPGNNVRQALESSARRLGFTGPIAWINTTGAEMPLGTSDTFTIIEGIDPIALVALDSKTCELLASAYRCQVPTDTLTRVFGRKTAAFRNFAKMLESEDSKQRAWAILKKLT